MEKKPFVDGVCTIHYREDGEVREWTIGCDAENDTLDDLRAHLKRWKPHAEFLSVIIERRKREGDDVEEAL